MISFYFVEVYRGSIEGFYTEEWSDCIYTGRDHFCCFRGGWPGGELSSLGTGTMDGGGLDHSTNNRNGKKRKKYADRIDGLIEMIVSRTAAGFDVSI
jgi:hypothetical protein